MSSWFYSVIWWLSENTGIGLGRFAPYVFHQMIGGDKVCKEINSEDEE